MDPVEREVKRRTLLKEIQHFRGEAKRVRLEEEGLRRKARRLDLEADALCEELAELDRTAGEGR